MKTHISTVGNNCTESSEGCFSSGNFRHNLDYWAVHDLLSCFFHFLAVFPSKSLCSPLSDPQVKGKGILLKAWTSIEEKKRQQLEIKTL